MRFAAILLLVPLFFPAPASASRADLARARTLYNQRQFDAALEAAVLAQKTPDTLDPATVLLARAHLERYRERADPADLSAARNALSSVRAPGLEPRDRVDLVMALGEALFFEDDYGAAASLFESGLESAMAVGPEQADAMLDWWGSAIERHAGTMERADRAKVLERMGDRMAREILRNPAAGVAAYWVVVAARGSGDLLGAWDAAIAGWVRAKLVGERAPTLRADLDKLVLEGIIPDRVSALPQDRRAQASSELRAEWELVKQRWK